MSTRDGPSPAERRLRSSKTLTFGQIKDTNGENVKLVMC